MNSKINVTEVSETEHFAVESCERFCLWIELASRKEKCLNESNVRQRKAPSNKSLWYVRISLFENV